MTLMWLTFLSLSSSSLIESFCSSDIRSLVAIKRKSLSLDVICSHNIYCIICNWCNYYVIKRSCYWLEMCHCSGGGAQHGVSRHTGHWSNTTEVSDNVLRYVSLMQAGRHRWHRYPVAWKLRVLCKLWNGNGSGSSHQQAHPPHDPRQSTLAAAL